MSMEDWFFPPEELPTWRKREAENRALGVCARCPVVQECLEDEFDMMNLGLITQGIRGGMTQQQRFAVFDRRHPGRAHKIRW